MTWYFIMVLICISLIISDVHLFVYMLAICMPLEKCVSPLPIFQLGYFCYWVVCVLCIFQVLTPYQICGLWIFSPISYTAFLFCWWFSLLCRSFSVWCHPAYLFLLLLLVSSPKIFSKTNDKELFSFVFF